jgi:hypothetical protein
MLIIPLLVRMPIKSSILLFASGVRASTFMVAIRVSSLTQLLELLGHDPGPEEAQVNAALDHAFGLAAIQLKSRVAPCCHR